jgi:hypothetical protein
MTQAHKLLTFLPMAVLVTVLSGCADRYKEGYEAGVESGFRQGFDEATKQSRAECEERVDRQRDRCSISNSRTYSSTEVCGGGGVTVGGKHHPAGKTGCVRVFADGRVERY